MPRIILANRLRKTGVGIEHENLNFGSRPILEGAGLEKTLPFLSFKMRDASQCASR
jgi:hypothetical protein